MCWQGLKVSKVLGLGLASDPCMAPRHLPLGLLYNGGGGALANDHRSNTRHWKCGRLIYHISTCGFVFIFLFFILYVIEAALQKLQ